MASVNLNDDSYMVPIHPEHQEYLKFLFNGTLYQYSSVTKWSFQYNSHFTKLFKPVYVSLHNRGDLSVHVGSINDSFLHGDVSEECRCNAMDTIHLLSKLIGFSSPSPKIFVHSYTDFEFSRIHFELGR